MGLVQYMYTSVLVADASAQGAIDTASMAMRLGQEFGITGRVFANIRQAFVIMEGPEEIVERYFQSVTRDPMAGTQIVHVQRPIKAREFQDYSVWLNVGQRFQSTSQIRELTPETLPLAWPENLSAKVRIMAEAYLDSDMLAAC